ncbi:MAG: 4Fe-4S dicluster domain-containing protein [Alphaproteobacteria bacterium]|nr:4Fe-4S dicluster domain-containing protein [Alphaproteobacteria bacterium]
MTLQFLGSFARHASGSTAARTRSFPTADYNWTKHRWAFGVDATRCIGCLSCVVACKNENDVPGDPHHFRTWVERYVYVEGEDQPRVDSQSDPADIAASHPEAVDPYRFAAADEGKAVEKAFFVPKLCNHCERPPCVQVCPVGATFRTEDGVVLIDQNYCIGCRYCVQACPYGARTFSEVYAVADKCTWCYHRITKGLKPACVEACPVGARIFGDLDDPDSDISAFVHNNRLEVLKPEMGTKPTVFYVGIDKNVR